MDTIGSREFGGVLHEDFAKEVDEKRVQEEGNDATDDTGSICIQVGYL